MHKTQGTQGALPEPSAPAPQVTRGNSECCRRARLLTDSVLSVPKVGGNPFSTIKTAFLSPFTPAANLRVFSHPISSGCASVNLKCPTLMQAQLRNFPQTEVSRIIQKGAVNLSFLFLRFRQDLFL